MMNIIKRVQDWWGGYLYKNDPDSQLLIIGMVYPKPRLYWDALMKHMEQHWQFWIGTVIAVLGLWFSL